MVGDAKHYKKTIRDISSCICFNILLFIQYVLLTFGYVEYTG